MTSANPSSAAPSSNWPVDGSGPVIHPNAFPVAEGLNTTMRGTTALAPAADVLPKPADKPSPSDPVKVDDGRRPRDESSQGRGGEGRGGQAETASDTRSLLPPKPANARYNTLDLWRGAACLMLLLYHSTFYADFHFRLSDVSTWSWAGLPLNLVRHCWYGVPIFFVISGYCIAASIDSLRRRPHSLRDYFIRRFRRIYPPLWIMYGFAVLFTLAVTQVPTIRQNCLQLPNLADFTTWQWLGNFLVAEAWLHNVVGGEPAYLMSNTWTLCYEEQFYCVAGLMLACSGRHFFRLAAGITAVVFVTRHVLRLSGIPQEGFFWDGHWMLFAAGILVYHTLNYKPNHRWWTVGLLSVGVAYGLAERFLCENPVDKHFGEYTFVACAFAIALLFLRRWDEPISRHPIFAPLRWCGQRSYSIYLTHFLLVVVASSLMALGGWTSELLVATVVVPACVAISIPIAVLYYLGVERHFTNPPLRAKKAQPSG